jgi:hypothetical protein
MSEERNGLILLDNEDEELRAKLFELEERLGEYKAINTRFINIIKKWNEHAYLNSDLNRV